MSLIIVVLASLVNVLLNILLVPQHGALGAAWAVNLTYMFNFVISIIIMWNYLWVGRDNDVN